MHSFDYGNSTDFNNILDINKHLIKRHDMKCLDLFKKMFNG